MKPDSIRMMPIGEIQPYYNNPRRHDNISEVKESIRRVGFRGSIWVDANNVIIAGHGRKCCMMELDPHYCDVIISRWEKLTGETAVRIEG